MSRRSLTTSARFEFEGDEATKSKRERIASQRVERDGKAAAGSTSEFRAPKISGTG